MTEAERIAAHESGHACACLLLGVPVLRIDVAGDATALGRVRHGLEDITSQADARTRMLIILCGPIMAGGGGSPVGKGCEGYRRGGRCEEALRKRPLMSPSPGPADGDLDPESMVELRRLARSRPRSGRAAVAKASAIRTLERLGRERRKEEVPPMPEGWYPHEPGDPFYELDWVFLHEHPDILRRHWELA